MLNPSLALTGSSLGYSQPTVKQGSQKRALELTNAEELAGVEVDMRGTVESSYAVGDDTE